MKTIRKRESRIQVPVDDRGSTHLSAHSHAEPAAQLEDLRRVQARDVDAGLGMCPHTVRAQLVPRGALGERARLRTRFTRAGFGRFQPEWTPV